MVTKTEFVMRPNILDFEIFDAEGQNVIYMADGAQDRHTTIELTNVCGKQLEIKKEDTANHFEIRFRPSTLSSKSLNKNSSQRMALEAVSIADNNTIAASDIAFDFSARTNGISSLCFRFTREFTLGPDEKITVVLKNVTASPLGGSRGTRAELQYKNVYLGEGTPASGTRLSYLNIINQRGSDKVPFVASFNSESAGSAIYNGNEVLNDGSENSLSLSLRAAGDSGISLYAGDSGSVNPAEAATNFKIMFETSVGADGKSWQLMGANDANAVALQVVDAGQIQWTTTENNQAKTHAWTISPRADVDDREGEIFTLNLTKIKTTLPSGIANIYLHYENLPGYRDGVIVVPVKKTPLITKGDKVGIGTTNPLTELSISPNQAGSKITLWDGGNSEQHYGFGMSSYQLEYRVDSTSSRHVFYAGGKRGESAGTELMRIMGNGKVGIGTTSPQKQLDVAGDINTSSKIQENGNDLLPTGSIIMWSGSSSSIPAGWALCDGNRDTPNLSGRFIVGTGKSSDGNTTYSRRSTGGEEKHKLTEEEMPVHTHKVYDPGHKHDMWLENSGTSTDEDDDSLPVSARTLLKYTTEVAHTGITLGTAGGQEAFDNRPPYYALCFIMKT